MKKYIGKFFQVDWNQIIKNLDGVKRQYETTPSNYQDKKEIEAAFKNVANIINFETFHDGFGNVNKEFGNWLNVLPVMCWISEMKTGYCVPPHIDDKEINEVIGEVPKDNFVRYHCHISNPCMGSTLIVEQDCYHMEEQGAVYQWDKIDAEHCGFNIGKQIKYIYHFIGQAE